MAKWTLTVFVGIGVISLAVQVATGVVHVDLLGALTLASVALELAAVSFLFRPDAKRWFARLPEVDPEIFR